MDRRLFPGKIARRRTWYVEKMCFSFGVSRSAPFSSVWAGLKHGHGFGFLLSWLWASRVL
jgi:hypothetical protein